MASDGWQQKAIKRVKAVLEADEDVKGLVLIGSYTRDDIKTDIWSDVDIVVVVADQAVSKFYPATDWISPIGEPYCFNQSSTDDYSVTRAYQIDGSRLDFMIVSESSLKAIGEWEDNPLRYINTCLFSRSPVLDEALGMSFPPAVLKPVPPEQFDRTANDFRFKGMLAVSKIGREELLVALHLSLDMIRDCLVLAMMLRDREAGSNHHRDGSQGNHFIAKLQSTQQPYSAQGILNSIEQSALAFDRLAVQFRDGYEPRSEPLLEWVRQARKQSTHE
jgi:hypothetical protein